MKITVKKGEVEIPVETPDDEISSGLITDKNANSKSITECVQCIAKEVLILAHEM